MHQISEIEKLSSGRYYITLDDGLQFPLYGKEMGKYGIEGNEVLSEEAYLEIMLELKKQGITSIIISHKLNRCV